MRLSIESYGPQKVFGEKEGLKQIRDAGFDCVDYSFYYRPDTDPFFGENSVEYAKEIRAYLDEIGLVCNQAHAPFAVEYNDPFDESFFPYRAIVRSMEAAAILGAKAIVVHAVGIRDASARQIEDYNYNYYKTLEPYAQKFGIRIAVENLFNTDKKRNSYENRRLGTPELLNRMLERLDSEWFTACVDLGHASMTGFEPEEFLRDVTPGQVTCLHVQDNDYRGDRHQLPFMCDLNWSEIMKTLKEIGYEGELTFEIFKYLTKMPKPLFSDALVFAEKVGRYLIHLWEQA